MSELVSLIRAIVGDELARRAEPQLGVVTAVHARDSNASDNNHQVNVRVPASGVELQRVAVAVDRAGRSCLPRVGDLVLVLFVGGDLQGPVVVGTLYDASVRPPVTKPAEVIYEPPDPQESGVRRLAAKLPSGAQILFDDGRLIITLGTTEVVIEADGDVSIKSAAKISIEAQADISVEAAGNLDIKAQGNLTLSGMATTLEGQGAATVKGPVIKVAGATQFSPS
jgi:phage baseplate assembly protein gpV